MRYMFQRVVHNEASWKKPTIGRLNTKIDKGYIVENGFGHEDWNFSGDVAKDKYVHGYSYQMPKDSSGNFIIVFAVYTRGIGWSVCGYYENVIFDSAGADFSDSILSRRAEELLYLRQHGSLGGEFQRRSKATIIAKLKSEKSFYRLKVSPNDVHSLQVPVNLSADFTNRVETTGKRFGAYFSTMTEISTNEWKHIKSVISDFVDQPRLDDFSDGGDVEFPEGAKVQKNHFSYERNAQLVREVKANFLKKHKRLFCEVCNFDFRETYGALGDGFIEAHHIVPLSESTSKRNSRPSDLALVCSNCHRMLHRKRPWAGGIAELKGLLKDRG